MDPPLLRQCDVTDDANIVEDFSLDGTADKSGRLREFKQIFVLFSI